MGTHKKVAAIRKTAQRHPAEDRHKIHRFLHGSVDVVVVAVSDGCTTNYMTHDPQYQPELGAVWLCRGFTILAEALYREGLRGLALGKEIVKRLLADMRNDCLLGRPDPSNLVATLLGFVVDDDELLLVISGDGTVFKNAASVVLPETDSYLVNSPDEFEVRVCNLRDIRSFVIATDGLSKSMQARVAKWSSEQTPDPDVLVDALAVIRPEKSSQDDVTVVALSVR